MDSSKQAGLSFCWTAWLLVWNAASAPFDKAGFLSRCAAASKEFLDNNDCTNSLFLAANLILSLDQNDGVLLYTHSVSHAHFSDTFSLRGVQMSRTRMVQGVYSAHVISLHLTLSMLMFHPLSCCSLTVTSRPPSRLSRLHFPCRAVPDPKARVKRTSARVAGSLATSPIPRTPQVMIPKSWTR